jgi:zinc and cadmium transporter
MGVWINTIVSVLIVSAVSLIGIAIFLFTKEKFNRMIIYLVSLSAGTLFGGAFIHLLPESFEKIPNHLVLSLSIILGIVSFYVLENFIHWRHCHVPTSKSHPHPVGLMNLIGDGFHNLIDGMVIAAAYMINFQVGLATTFAVLIHEIPQEIGDFGVLIHAGYSKGKAMFFNFLSALAALVGAVLMILLGSTFADFAVYILPFTAGGFIYIAGSDLIPELRKECYPISKVFLQLLWVIIGIGLMVGLLFTGDVA